MLKKLAKIFKTKSSRKYIYSELIAYASAMTATAVSANFTEQHTHSDLLISVVSAIIGSCGFLSAALVSYILLNIPEYIGAIRTPGYDVSVILRSYFKGLLATYAFRIPFQFFIQKIGMPPTAAAPFAQVISGQVGNIIRIYFNYRARIFGEYSDPHGQESSDSVKAETEAR